jgi:hypothetical protein
MAGVSRVTPQLFQNCVKIYDGGDIGGTYGNYMISFMPLIEIMLITVMFPSGMGFSYWAILD